MQNIRTFAVLGVSAALLSLAGCGGTCTAEAPPAVVLYLTADGAESQVLCDAQVVAYTDDGFVTYANGYSSGASSCRFDIGHDQPGTYYIQIQAQGYEAVLLDDIKVETDGCHPETVQLAETLVPSTSNCHDGYEWVDSACKTPNGCAFPQFERQVLPGVQGADISYECISSCENIGTNQYEMPQAPGKCAVLALP